MTKYCQQSVVSWSVISCFVTICEGLHCNEIQESLCDAVNNLVKHFYKPEKEASFADLMSLLFPSS